jgi:hypothetical protein
VRVICDVCKARFAWKNIFFTEGTHSNIMNSALPSQLLTNDITCYTYAYNLTNTLTYVWRISIVIIARTQQPEGGAHHLLSIYFQWMLYLNNRINRKSKLYLQVRHSSFGYYSSKFEALFRLHRRSSTPYFHFISGTYDCRIQTHFCRFDRLPPTPENRFWLLVLTSTISTSSVS